MAFSTADKALGLFQAAPSSLGQTMLLKEIADMEAALAPLQIRMQELINNAANEKKFRDHEAVLLTNIDNFNIAKEKWPPSLRQNSQKKVIFHIGDH